MPEQQDFNDVELARWLQEAGRRRVVRNGVNPLPEAIPGASSAVPVPATKQYVRNPRAMTLLAIAALAYMPYFFADVYVQISSLPCVIVFV